MLECVSEPSQRGLSGSDLSGVSEARLGQISLGDLVD